MRETHAHTHLLIARKRGGFTASIAEYPNTLTLDSINEEVQKRIDEGFEPIEAFLTVAEGVRNWRGHEPWLAMRDEDRRSLRGI